MDHQDLADIMILRSTIPVTVGNLLYIWNQSTTETPVER